jgi:hypothetical protein
MAHDSLSVIFFCRLLSKASSPSAASHKQTIYHCDIDLLSINSRTRLQAAHRSAVVELESHAYHNWLAERGSNRTWIVRKLQLWCMLNVVGNQTLRWIFFSQQSQLKHTLSRAVWGRNHWQVEKSALFITLVSASFNITNGFWFPPHVQAPNCCILLSISSASSRW